MNTVPGPWKLLSLAPAILAIRLVWKVKGLPRTNTLAYLSSSLLTKKKVLKHRQLLLAKVCPWMYVLSLVAAVIPSIIQWSGINVIKLFNKLECLSLGGPSNLVQGLWVRPEPTWMKDLSLIGRLLALLTHISLGRKGLPRTRLKLIVNTWRLLQ